MVSFRSHLAVTRAPGERSKKLALAEGTGSQIRMTNDEIRRNDEIPMTKTACAQHRTFRHSSFGFLSSFVIRHSSFNFLCVFLSVFGWQPPACGASSVLGAWLNSQTRIQTWSAEVIQTRALKSLAQPLTATGRVWFAAPNRFRWELGNPAQTIALRQPDQMLVIYPKLKRAEKYPLTRDHAGPWTDTLALLEAGFPRSQSELESRFRIESEATAEGVHEVTLQPKISLGAPNDAAHQNRLCHWRFFFACHRTPICRRVEDAERFYERGAQSEAGRIAVHFRRGPDVQGDRATDKKVAAPPCQTPKP